LRKPPPRPRAEEEHRKAGKVITDETLVVKKEMCRALPLNAQNTGCPETPTQPAGDGKIARLQNPSEDEKVRAA